MCFHESQTKNETDTKLQVSCFGVRDVEVACGVYDFSSVKKKKEPEGWKQLWHPLPAPSCDDDAAAARALGVERNRRPMMRHRCVRRPTKFVATVDIKTAFHVAILTEAHVIMEDLDVPNDHWIMSHGKMKLEEMMKDLIEETERWDEAGPLQRGFWFKPPFKPSPR